MFFHLLFWHCRAGYRSFGFVRFLEFFGCIFTADHALLLFRVCLQFCGILLLSIRSMVPRVLPAHKSRTILLRAVHQLCWSALPPSRCNMNTYEEPH
jgi:hypothetical protein